MDSYLQIAQTVLQNLRQPLSPKAIINVAYQSEIVPPHLHGKTQHKTLQARLSEDILELHEKSLFFRTAPGKFFLREFLTDASLPEEYRQPISTRRRVRDLLRGPALALEHQDLQSQGCEYGRIETECILELLKNNQYRYEDPKSNTKELVYLWAFVSVWKSEKVLSYRLGRYRDDRDTFMFKRSIGFSTLVQNDQRTLFNFDNFGITDSGMHAAALDLDIPINIIQSKTEQIPPTLQHFIWISNKSGFGDLIAVMYYECPDWFEPTKRRLAINDLRWLDLSAPINDIDDFDPWSKSILQTGI